MREVHTDNWRITWNLFQYNMLFHHHRKSRCEDKNMFWPSYLPEGISHIGQMASYTETIISSSFHYEEIHLRTSNRSSKLRITSSNAKMFPCHDVIVISQRSTSRIPGLILGLRPINERRCYFVTTSLIGRAQTSNQPCIPFTMWLRYPYWYEENLTDWNHTGSSILVHQNSGKLWKYIYIYAHDRDAVG